MKKIIILLTIFILSVSLIPDTPPDGTVVVIQGKKFIYLSGILQPLDEDDLGLDPPPID